MRSARDPAESLHRGPSRRLFEPGVGGKKSDQPFRRLSLNRSGARRCRAGLSSASTGIRILT